MTLDKLASEQKAQGKRIDAFFTLLAQKGSTSDQLVVSYEVKVNEMRETISRLESQKEQLEEKVDAFELEKLGIENRDKRHARYTQVAIAIAGVILALLGGGAALSHVGAPSPLPAPSGP